MPVWAWSPLRLLDPGPPATVLVCREGGGPFTPAAPRFKRFWEVLNFCPDCVSCSHPGQRSPQALLVSRPPAAQHSFRKPHGGVDAGARYTVST